MTEVIVISPDELRTMIRDAVREVAPTQAPELSTTAELAKELDVSPDLIRLWVRERGCPHIRAGQKKYRFRLHDVIAWLEAKDA